MADLREANAFDTEKRDDPYRRDLMQKIVTYRWRMIQLMPLYRCDYHVAASKLSWYRILFVKYLVTKCMILNGKLQSLMLLVWRIITTLGVKGRQKEWRHQARWTITQANKKT